MPSKQHLPELIARSLSVLQSKLGLFEAAMRADLEQAAQVDRNEAIRVLQRKLAEAHEIIAEQDQLLQASLINQPVGTLASHATGVQQLDDVRLSEFAEELERQQRELTQKQQHVDDERALLREQAIRLDHDRLEFEVRTDSQLPVTGDHQCAIWTG